MAIADSLFGSYTNRNKKRISNLLDRVNSFALDCSKITTSKETSSIIENGRARRCTVEEKAFYDKTREFRDRLRDGESIQSIMPEALAVCREAIKRRLNMFPYDTQIEASIAMLGNVIGTNNDNEEVRERIIAEMKTGEGKTLVQILVAYLNALEATKDIDPRNWKSVHVMTSNDALAKRDCTDNGKVFNLLGLTCGFVPSNRSMKATTLAEQAINRRKKQTAYNSDVVYATTSTIAFDYLSDNRITDPKNRRINKEFGYAIIDEADDLLLDQAINPLILSGKQIGEEISEDTLDIKDYYKWATEFLYGKTRGKELTCVVCEKFERSKYKTFTEEHVEKMGVDYVIFLDSSEVVINPKIAEELSTSKSEDVNNMKYIALMDAIKAKHLFLKNVQYEVKVNGEEGTVILLDQNTGRRKYTSKYTEGMQEAVEAKEDFLENESKLAKKRYRIKFSKNIATKAMCTYPDFLSLYKGRVCGMTGTSDIDEM